MKKVEAIVEPLGVEAVKEGLTALGIHAITVSEVHNFGAAEGPTRIQRGVRYEPPYIAEAKVEIVVGDEAVDGVLDMLQQAAKADVAGSRRVYVYTLDTSAGLRSVKKSAAAV